MILVTGASGQLGFDTIKELEKRKAVYNGVTRSDFDITDFEKIKNYIIKEKPSCVIHCAAYTSVDKAEDEREICYKVNVLATENIAKACKKINAKLIYISTDYVFDGKGDAPHEVDDAINPLSVYGGTKYKGELIVKEILDKYFIVRTSWVFGLNGNNFVKKMIKLGKEKESINVVCDQIGSPTYTKDLAMVLCDMVESDKYGTYHATNEGFCSWAEFAEAIMKMAKIDCKINYIKTSEYKTKAVRPLNSRLSKKSLHKGEFDKLPNWEESLFRFINIAKNEKI
ncbi:MAG: dTDP-4-dehydrorhamnose reductase [Clostridium beijerinckii]|jgi:dTDP-4-dehydrorhamnose reductase|nr:dTDP-4-dehydrorhamnose reductase [Clostridium beijerinckii]MCI1577487.1 dTDP-4-dehydrorhamnose reductase [Clostridium beijerinckii]MCI1583260.1 dTDP-4-dehydrorhamnose reductase [Clostridium beijerinckii]MCI1621160.1 dTDP-4-dehydrorhamnose reductase [Clostridium beijerinckii]